MACILETGPRHGAKLYVRTDAPNTDFRMTDRRELAKQYATPADAIRASVGFSTLYDLMVVELAPEAAPGYRPNLNPYSATSIMGRR